MQRKNIQRKHDHRGAPTVPQGAPPNTIAAASTQKVVIAIVLIVALISFEIFNFDTTRFALSSLLGDVRFLGISWAAILAIVFCAIDFAGLTRIFTPEKGKEEPKAVWYLTGAWLLGATMNAMMTWWAVSLTLLSHEFGNEVLSREQLLQWVPLFVAVFVWLTRILFIGAMSVAGEYIFDFSTLATGKPTVARKKRPSANPRPMPPPTTQPMRAHQNRQPPIQEPNSPPQPGHRPPTQKPAGMYARQRR